MAAAQRGIIRLSKLPLFLLASLPLLWGLAGAFTWFGVSLGANPVEALLDLFGVWSLRILLLTLVMTPLRHWTGWTGWLAYRRMLGLFAFFYAVLHLLTYAVLDHRLAWAPIFEDILKRPFITIGVLAVLLLLPLAVTSTRGWMRRLGKRWQSLHRLVYPIAILAVWHYYWQVKLDGLEPTVYALILAVLLAERLRQRQRRLRRRQARRAEAGAAASGSSLDRSTSVDRSGARA